MMNKVFIIGRLTADPEIRQTQSGSTVARFTVAVDRRSKQENDADFISCTAFNKTAEFVGRYFTKGKPIAVEGNLRTGSYADKNHQDVTHYTTDVWVDNVEFCGNKNDGSTPQQTTAPATAPAQAEAEETSTEDVPF